MTAQASGALNGAAAVAPDPLHAFEVALPAAGPGGGAGGSVRVRVALHRYQLDLRLLRHCLRGTFSLRGCWVERPM